MILGIFFYLILTTNQDFKSINLLLKHPVKNTLFCSFISVLPNRSTEKWRIWCEKLIFSELCANQLIGTEVGHFLLKAFINYIYQWQCFSGRRWLFVRIISSLYERCALSFVMLVHFYYLKKYSLFNNQCHLFFPLFSLMTFKSHQNPETGLSSVILNMKRFHECFRLEIVRLAWRIRNIS